MHKMTNETWFRFHRVGVFKLYARILAHLKVRIEIITPHSVVDFRKKKFK